MMIVDSSYFFKNYRIAYFSNFSVSLLLVLTLYGSVEVSILLGWLAINYAILSIRIWLVSFQPYPNDPNKNLKTRQNLFYLGLLATGILWGVSPWMLFAEGDILRQFFLYIVLLGMTAGAPAVAAPDTKAFLYYSQPIMWLLSLYFLMQGGRIYFFLVILVQILNFSLFVSSVNFAKIDRKFKKAKEKSERASRAKSKFLANISHEIRTPMNAIVGLNHLLKQSELTHSQRDYVNKSLMASRSLLSTFQNILDYSKAESEETSTLQMHPFNLKKITSTVAMLIECDVQQKKLQFSLNIEESLPLQLKGDSIKLTQILSNLVENAIKFTDSGSISIFIKEAKRTNDKVLIHFSVRDTGIGIDVKDHDKLFQSFSQVNNSSSRQYHGTGLGLSISQKLTQLMGSTIKINSAPGKGSDFYFSIWFSIDHGYVAESPSEPHGMETATQAELAVQKGLSGLTVLLIEDDELNQIVARELLLLLDLHVVIAGSAQQAFTLLEKRLPDFILLDIQMPDMDGYEAISIIRSTRKWAKLPVICLTAYANPEERAKALSAGMDDFLTKPINPDTLEETLEKWKPEIKPSQETETSSIARATESDMRKNNEPQKPGKSDSSAVEITKNIEKLADTLGNQESSITFFQEMVAPLQKYIHELKYLLSNHEFAEAGLSAHRLKGTVSYYASKALKQCLQNIEDGRVNSDNVNDTLLFLSSEYDLVLELIDKKLSVWNSEKLAAK